MAKGTNVPVKFQGVEIAELEGNTCSSASNGQDITDNLNGLARHFRDIKNVLTTIKETLPQGTEYHIVYCVKGYYRGLDVVVTE